MPAAPTPQDVLELVLATIADLNRDLGLPALDGATAATPVYGGGSPLDSIGLVTLIAEIEARTSERWGVEIILADDRAMSTRRSPFRDVASLAEAVHERVLEAGATS